MWIQGKTIEKILQNAHEILSQKADLSKYTANFFNLDGTIKVAYNTKNASSPYNIKPNAKLTIFDIKNGNWSTKLILNDVVQELDSANISTLLTDIYDYIIQNASLVTMKKGVYVINLSGSNKTAAVMNIFQLPHNDVKIYEIVASDGVDCVKGNIVLGYNHQLKENISIFLIGGIKTDRLKEDKTKKPSQTPPKTTLNGLTGIFLTDIHQFIKNICMISGLQIEIENESTQAITNYVTLFNKDNWTKTAKYIIPICMEILFIKHLVSSIYLPLLLYDNSVKETFTTYLKDKFKFTLGISILCNFGITFTITLQDITIHFKLKLSKHSFSISIILPYAKENAVYQWKISFDASVNVAPISYKHENWIKKPIIIEETKSIIVAEQSSDMAENIQTITV